MRGLAAIVAATLPHGVSSTYGTLNPYAGPTIDSDSPLNFSPPIAKTEETYFATMSIRHQSIHELVVAFGADELPEFK